ncbi:MAG: hypothetical protein ACREMN_00495 [Gemmatimonadales bacterium]
MTDARAAKDPLALGLGSLTTGIGFGGACLTAAQVIAGIMRERLDPALYRESAPDPLTAGLILAVGVGGGYSWYRSWAVENLWQRGVIAVLAAVGAILVGFLAAPVDGLFGLIGLVVWLALTLAVGVAGSRWADRGRGTDDQPAQDSGEPSA